MKKQATLFVTAIIFFCSFVTSETEPKYYEVCRKIENLSKTLLLQAEIIKPRPQKYMSRCPTGLRAYYDAKLETYPIYQGILNYHYGCEPKKVCLYQLNYKTNKLLVKSERSDKYIAIEKWIKIEQAKQQNKSTSL